VNKRTVVVTGGRRGIGAAVVAAFRERGDRVIALDKDYPPGLAADQSKLRILRKPSASLAASMSW
jgi:NAD(P)-dependent dehydrogenase (short-subunit alcohol dehydrogenase family)